MDKPRVLLAVLCGTERHQWLNPQLAQALLQFSKDKRFDIDTAMVMERWVDRARNVCMTMARECGASWVIQIDNDVVPPDNLLDILAEADQSGKDCVGLSYAVFQGNGLQIIPTDNGPRDGQFRKTGLVGGGVLMVRSRVWQQIPGPWFRWLVNDDETSTLRLGEDYYFSELVQRHGFTVWTHDDLAKHFWSCNLTELARRVPKMRWTT